MLGRLSTKRRHIKPLSTSRLSPSTMRSGASTKRRPSVPVTRMTSGCRTAMTCARLTPRSTRQDVQAGRSRSSATAITERGVDQIPTVMLDVRQPAVKQAPNS